MTVSSNRVWWTGGLDRVLLRSGSSMSPVKRWRRWWPWPHHLVPIRARRPHWTLQTRLHIGAGVQTVWCWDEKHCRCTQTCCCLFFPDWHLEWLPLSIFKQGCLTSMHVNEQIHFFLLSSSSLFKHKLWITWFQSYNMLLAWYASELISFSPTHFLSLRFMV